MVQPLSNLCYYADEQVAVDNLDLDNYISTENMISNKKGITRSTGLPAVSQTSAYKNNDVLVSNIRPYFRKIWLADRDGGCSNDILVLRTKKNCKPAFLYYLLSDNKFFDYATAASKGTKMPRGDKGAIMQYIVPDLSLDTQSYIATILDVLDKRIATNKKINHNLEQTTQAIYANFIANINGSTTKLKKLCVFQEGYVNPSQNCADYFDGSVKWLRAVDINESFIFDTSRTLTNHGFESAGKSAVLFKPNTIAISKSGTIGRLGFVADFMCGNRAVINITPNDSRILPFIYLYLKSRQTEYSDLAVGSVQKNLYVSILQELDIIVPEQIKLLDFCMSVTSLFEQWKNNVAENQLLSQIRDALLPRLMSGELSSVDSF
jgi:type I restriction enzyme S subunit